MAFANWRKRAARDRQLADWRGTNKLLPPDARDTNPDPCPRSRFGIHRYDDKLINANREPICDFCHQVKIERP